jgi:hypothetical protein
MESLDLELELNALRYNSHLDSDFDSATEIDEFSERIIERSKPLQKSREKSADWLSRTSQQTIQLPATWSQQRTGFDRCWLALRNVLTK